MGYLELEERFRDAVIADGRDGRPDAFVQWKGTDLCMDFVCVCGVTSHVDGYFCYAVQCANCDRRFRLAPTVLVDEVPAGDDDPASMQVMDPN